MALDCHCSRSCSIHDLLQIDDDEAQKERRSFGCMMHILSNC
ncbi:hypothetical protein TorRG33x02_118920 [Trema orientale]|uniref:Uncharacterized protein n=1 Tax=Trema orientale TaxID=63057 RepID=A0A2P5F387_TREOI|nr:hypothetical protein TorRG33x02_118920 [Trema orientale]